MTITVVEPVFFTSLPSTATHYCAGFPLPGLPGTLTTNREADLSVVLRLGPVVVTHLVLLHANG